MEIRTNSAIYFLGVIHKCSSIVSMLPLCILSWCWNILIIHLSWPLNMASPGLNHSKQKFSPKSKEPSYPWWESQLWWSPREMVPCSPLWHLSQQFSGEMLSWSSHTTFRTLYLKYVSRIFLFSASAQPSAQKSHNGSSWLTRDLTGMRPQHYVYLVGIVKIRDILFIWFWITLFIEDVLS